MWGGEAWRRGGGGVEPERALPYALVPLAMVTGAGSPLLTALVLAALGTSLLYLARRAPDPLRPRNQFFYSWTLASIITLFLVFEFHVLSLLEITQGENLAFLILLMSSIYSLYMVRSIAREETEGVGKGKNYSPVLTSDSLHCSVCQIEIYNRYFHSIWLDCCISSRNHKQYLAFLVLADLCLIFAADLGLTTVCQPYVLYGTVLMPEDCSDVYYDFDLAICFVSCVYAIGYALVITLVLIHQLLKYLLASLTWMRPANVLSV